MMMNEDDAADDDDHDDDKRRLRHGHVRVPDGVGEGLQQGCIGTGHRCSVEGHPQNILRGTDEACRHIQLVRAAEQRLLPRMLLRKPHGRVRVRPLLADKLLVSCRVRILHCNGESGAIRGRLLQDRLRFPKVQNLFLVATGFVDCRAARRHDALIHPGQLEKIEGAS